jgi:DNA polymerase I
MTFKIDFRDDAALVWSKTGDGDAVAERDPDYRPRFYVGGPDDALATVRDDLASGAVSGVASVTRESWYTDLATTDRSSVLRVDLAAPRGVRRLARRLRRRYGAVPDGGDAEAPPVSLPPGTLRFYNVDLAPQFRYCLQTGLDPTPPALTRTSLSVTRTALAREDVSDLRLDGDPVGGGEPATVRAVGRRLARDDPDVLAVSHADLVPLLVERAAALDVDLQLGRAPGYERLASANTYHSYGQTGHSPARYDVPGRVLLDRSNSFLWSGGSLAGLRYLVSRSWRPLQETAWGSIGTVLTSMQIRRAYREREVLAPWEKWEPERFKSPTTLRTADRGGFTFSPRVGVHDDVCEVDFSSLYPNVMREYNVSPETVLCDCHADRTDVPELGYSVCDRPGFLGEVLGPLLDDRARCKRAAAELAARGDDDAAADARTVSGAIKWVLVSCFGYQGYRNAKFGRIECHEAINAYAREAMLTAKETFEAGGWTVVHGVVDSLWVRPRPEADDPAPLDDLTAAVTDAVGVELEFEDAYDWVAFVPKRGTDRGALTRYFGKVAGEDRYKIRGIGARQRSTTDFVAAAQRDLLRVVDRHRDPAAVCDRLRRHLGALRRGAVPAEELLVRRRVSQPLSAYRSETLTVAALRRARADGLDVAPGEDVRFVVVDDDARRTRERVRLAHELDADGGLPGTVTPDADYYAERLCRAAESVTAPLGWDRSRLDRFLWDTREVGLSAFE